MRSRVILAATAVCGMAAAASAQAPTATLTLNWKNMATGVPTPLQPGDSAAIWVDVAFTPPVGAVIQTPSGPGTMAGLASIFFDLVGTGNPAGSWMTTGAGFGGTPNIDGPFTNTNSNSFGRRNDLAGGWGLGGAGQQGGGPIGGTINDFMAAGAGQFPLSPPANGVNPVREIWRASWTPDDYSPRVITYQSRKADASPNTGIAILVLLPGDIHVSMHVPAENITWGSALLGIPSPTSLTLMTMGGVLALRRRR